MPFALTPAVPPNIQEDKVYSISDFNNYFDQLQKIISEHDDTLANLISGAAGYLPFYEDPVDTIDKILSVGIYYLTSSVGGTFPSGSTKSGSFLISTSTMQFLFDTSGIYCRTNNASQWSRLSGAAVIDSLTSTSAIDALSANQGKVLNDKKLDHFYYTEEDNVDIDNLPQGIHTFLNAKISGTFPEFSGIDPTTGTNKFIVESFGVMNELVFQILSDIPSSTIGVRVGTNTMGIDGEQIWQFFEWEQLVTARTLGDQIEETVNSMRPFEYHCTKGEQIITLDPGTYDIECWGAQGGGYAGSSTDGGQQGGAGGYAKARFSVTQAQELYAYVGEHPTTFLGGFPFAGSSKPEGGPFKGKGFGGGGCSYISQYEMPSIANSLVLGEEFAAIVPSPSTRSYNMGVITAFPATVAFELPGANHWSPTDHPNYGGGFCTKLYLTINNSQVREILETDLDTTKGNTPGASGLANIKITLQSTEAKVGDLIGVVVDINVGHHSTYTSPIFGRLSGSVAVLELTEQTNVAPAGSDLFSVGAPLICAGGGGGASSFSPGAVSGQLSVTSGSSGEDSTNEQFGAGGSGYKGGKAATTITTPGGGGTNYIASSTSSINISNTEMKDGVRYGDGLIKITRIGTNSTDEGV